MIPLSLAEVARRRRALQLFSSPPPPLWGGERDENVEAQEEGEV